MTTAAAPRSSDAGGAGTQDLRHYVAAARRNLILGLVVTAVVVAAVAAYLARTPSVYTGRASLTINVITSTPFEANVRPDLLVVAGTETKIATSSAVIDRAAELLGRTGQGRRVAAGVTVTVPPKSQVLMVEYDAASAGDAAAGANAVATAYLEHRASEAQAGQREALRQIDDHLTPLREELAKVNGALASQPAGSSAARDSTASRDVLTSQLSAIRQRQSAIATMPLVPGELVTRAQPPTAPSAPHRSQVLLAGLLIGLVLGLVAAFVRDRNNPAVRDVPELEAAAGLPLLARIPAEPTLRRRPVGLAVVTRPAGTTAEAFRRCRARVSALDGRGESARPLLVVDTGRDNAAGVIAANLAVTLARSRQRVVLVLVEDRLEAVQQVLGVGPGPGLSDVLQGRATLAQVLVPVRDVLDLQVLRPGTDAGQLPDLLADRDWQQIEQELSEAVGRVVIGAPSSTERLGTVLELARSSRTLLVAERGRSTRVAVAGIVDDLDLVKTQWAGVLLRGRLRSGSSRPRSKGPAVADAAPKDDEHLRPVEDTVVGNA